MKEILSKFEQLLPQGAAYITRTSDSDLMLKTSPEKWSKKEILGHLIDSGVNNLQRFAEVQFESKPYKIINYNQDELVKVNDYQHADKDELVNLLMSLNHRILFILKRQPEETLAYEMEYDSLEGKKLVSLRFWIADYVDHLEHHLNQIIE